VIESCQEPGYFTEKIIDCFLTGTIPIYWGDPNIRDIFNPGGILFWDGTISGLKKVLFLATGFTYSIKTGFTQENFEIAHEYTDHIKWLKEHYPETFND
jgi:hypothetical protein